jgi:hypothetical protein
MTCRSKSSGAAITAHTETVTASSPRTMPGKPSETSNGTTHATYAFIDMLPFA